MGALSGEHEGQGTQEGSRKPYQARDKYSRVPGPWHGTCALWSGWVMLLQSSTNVLVQVRLGIALQVPSKWERMGSGWIHREL